MTQSGPTNSTDRITASETKYVTIGSDIWQETTTRTYPTAGSSTPLTLSVQRRQLTGLGGSTGAGILTGVTESIDVHGNTTTATTTVNATTHTVTETVDYSDSNIDGLTETVDGLVTTQKSKTGITNYFTYDALRGAARPATRGPGSF